MKKPKIPLQTLSCTRLPIGWTKTVFLYLFWLFRPRIFQHRRHAMSIRHAGCRIARRTWLPRFAKLPCPTAIRACSGPGFWPHLPPGSQPKPSQIRDLLTDSIFGVDAESDACNVTELSLILTLLDYADHRRNAGCKIGHRVKGRQSYQPCARSGNATDFNALFIPRVHHLIKLGYDQSENGQTWAARIERSLMESPQKDAFRRQSRWRHEPVIKDLPHTYRSGHGRG